MYYETTSEIAGYRVPVKTDEGPGTDSENIMDWIPKTFFPAVAPGTFDLPPICSKDKVCPKASLCTVIRGDIGYDTETIELVQ